MRILAELKLFHLTDIGLLFKVIMFGVVVGVLRVLICIGVEMTGSLLWILYIKLHSSSSSCGLLLKNQFHCY